MKRDRRLELLIDLLNGDWISRELLADKYSVTKKTISRDVEYLNSIGIPIQSKSGVSGGFKLEDSFKANHLMNETEQQKEVLKELIGPDRLAEEQVEYVVDALKEVQTLNINDAIAFEFKDVKKNLMLEKLTSCISTRSEVTIKYGEKTYEGIPVKLIISDEMILLEMNNNVFDVSEVIFE